MEDDGRKKANLGLVEKSLVNPYNNFSAAPFFRIHIQFIIQFVRGGEKVSIRLSPDYETRDPVNRRLVGSIRMNEV